MATGGVAALTAGTVVLGLLASGCGHSAPRTREVSVVVNEAGDPQQKRLSELRHRYVPGGTFKIGQSQSSSFTIGESTSSQPTTTSETTLSWDVPANELAGLLPRLRGERYVLQVTVTG